MDAEKDGQTEMKPEVEEALEKLYLFEQEKEAYPADAVTQSALREAAAGGLAAEKGGRLRLSESGLAAGREVVRRHRLAECLLKDVLGVAAEEFDADACEFEHILRHGLEEKICVLLGHPTQCPHGRVIPPGECCRKAKADRIREVSPLSEGKVGAEGAVAYLATTDNREVQKMMSIGILPGAEIRLIRRFPSFVFQVGYSQFAIDRRLAAIIHVHWNQGRK